MIKILFVCLGNICRSTMAEAVMRHLINEQGLSARIVVDSAGTGNWHVGEAPHSGTRKRLAREGISTEGIFARQITKEDITEFDYIIGMDSDNLKNIRPYCKPEDINKACLLADFVENNRWTDVPDPWYSGDFDETYRLVREGCEQLLARLRLS